MPTNSKKSTSGDLSAILEGLIELVELKRTSRDPKDKHQLPVLEETLRQLEED